MFGQRAVCSQAQATMDPDRSREECAICLFGLRASRANPQEKSVGWKKFEVQRDNRKGVGGSAVCTAATVWD